MFGSFVGATRSGQSRLLFRPLVLIVQSMIEGSRGLERIPASFAWMTAASTDRLEAMPLTRLAGLVPAPLAPALNGTATSSATAAATARIGRNRFIVNCPLSRKFR